MTVPSVPPSLDGGCLVMFTIYWNPIDYPGMYAVRRWRAIADNPEPVPDPEPCYVGDWLAEARNAIPHEANYCMHRSPDDDPSIVETWL